MHGLLFYPSVNSLSYLISYFVQMGTCTSKEYQHKNIKFGEQTAGHVKGSLSNRLQNSIEIEHCRTPMQENCFAGC